MEFILNERDWPQSQKFTTPQPVLSFSKVSHFFSSMICNTLYGHWCMYLVCGNTMCASTCWVDYFLLRTCLALYSTTAD